MRCTSRNSQLLRALSLCLVIGVSGCASLNYVQVREHAQSPLTERFKLAFGGKGRVSDRTKQFMVSHGYSRISTVGTMLQQTQVVHQQHATPESTHALAELNYIAGRKCELHDPDSAAEYYYDGMAAAYGYLFHSRFGPVRNPYDPQFSGACDLYNESIERLLRIADKKGEFVPGRSIHLPISGRKLDVVVSGGRGSWKPQHYDRFRFVSDYKLVGLQHKHSAPGLGVPLIAVRKSGTEPAEVEKYYPDQLSFPVTAFVKFHEGDMLKDGCRCSIEFHNPLETSLINVAKGTVPLRSDISTPMAWFLDRPKFRYIDTIGLLRPDKADDYRGLYLMQPYQADKIPVLMVHGIWSSPMTWMDMLNDLMARPEIRERYQFWLYLYPTGEPLSYATADLRNGLDELRDTFDPNRQHRPLDDMVVVGHSMGGLMSRMLAMQSGNRFWRTVSNTPFDQARLDPKTRAEIRQVYFFEPHPSVSRVITIASPFRGSTYSNRFTRWLASSVISLPGRTMDSISKVFQAGGGRENTGRTSLDALAADSPVLAAMNRSPLRPGVRLHNIIAVKDRKASEPSDGVVTFPSAYRRDVQSQLVVEAEHSTVQRAPETVMEVMRILLRHIQEPSLSRYPAAYGVPDQHRSDQLSYPLAP